MCYATVITFETKKMKFDDVIVAVGEFGPFQRRVYFLICLVSVPTAFQTLMTVFTLYLPDHRCAIPVLDNDTYKSQGPWHDILVNQTIPWVSEKNMFSQCDIFMQNVTQDKWTNRTIQCDKWVYDKEIFYSTFVTEKNLVCADRQLRTYANMALMGGMLAGALTLSSLSDKFGRKKVFVICVIGHFSSSLATGFVQSYTIFICLRFLTTFSDVGMVMSSYIIGVELVGPSKRTFVGIVVHLFWCLGILIMAGVSYGIRYWHHLQIVLSCPTILLLTYVVFLPESPRWLINAGRTEDASNIIRRVAKENRALLWEKILSLEGVQFYNSEEKIWHMFTDVTLLLRCLAICANWFVASMVYYGLSLNVGSLTGDVFLNFVLYGVVEAASYVVCLLLLDRVGRRLLQCGSMIVGGVACMLTMFPVIFGSQDQAWVTVTLSLIGKFGASAAFAVIYFFTAELFPTVMRNSGLGMCSVMARIGGILAPYIADIGNVITGNMAAALPLLIFGGTSIVAGLLALLLPETANKMLPDTVEDVKRFDRKYSSDQSKDLIVNGENKQKTHFLIK